MHSLRKEVLFRAQPTRGGPEKGFTGRRLRARWHVRCSDGHRPPHVRRRCGNRRRLVHHTTAIDDEPSSPATFLEQV